MPNDFFKDRYITNIVDEAIVRSQQERDLNEAYQEFVTAINTELDRKAEIKSIRKTNVTFTKQKSFYKPYWDNELQKAWNEKVKSEKKWMKEQGPGKRRLRAEYCAIRKTFDRMLRKAKRQYQ